MDLLHRKSFSADRLDLSVLRSDGLIISDEHRPSAYWNTAELCAGIRAVDGCVTVDGADALEPYWKARYPDRSTP